MKRLFDFDELKDKDLEGKYSFACIFQFED